MVHLYKRQNQFWFKNISKLKLSFDYLSKDKNLFKTLKGSSAEKYLYTGFLNR